MVLEPCTPFLAPDRWRRIMAPDCLACGLQPGDPFCPGCEADFAPATRARCPRCAARLATPCSAAAAPPCGACLANPPQFDATVALGDYRAPLDAMIRALKSSGRLDIGRALGSLLARRARPRLAPGSLVVPVPLALERWRERGYNQALELARPVAARLGMPLAPAALARTRHAVPQQRLGRAQRRHNVVGAFAAGVPLAGRTIVVVDDVMTTGATLDAAAAALRAGGARHITNLVVARTP